MTAMHPSCQAIDELLAAYGVPGRVQILRAAAPTAQTAADQLGCPVGAIANSLIFVTGRDQPVLVMTSGAHRVDTRLVGDLLGTPIRRASPDFVRRHTGQPIGGVAPLGHPTPIRTLVDDALARYDPLWAAGGIPHAVFPISYADLVRITEGHEISVN